MIKEDVNSYLNLLCEMQNKARASIIKGVKIDPNILNGIALILKNNELEYRKDFYIKFILNDKVHIVEGYLDEEETFMIDEYTSKYNRTDNSAYKADLQRAIIDNTVKGLSKAIAIEMMRQFPDFASDET